MQEDIEQRTVALSTKATKITDQTRGKLMKAELQRMRGGRAQGKKTVKQLARQNAGLQNIEITDDNFKAL